MSKLLDNKQEAYIQIYGKYLSIVNDKMSSLSISNPDKQAFAEIKELQRQLTLLFNIHFQKTKH